MSRPFDELRIVFVTELTRRVRSRLFWIATLAGMVAIAILVEAPVFFAAAGRSSSSDIMLAGAPALRSRAVALLDAKNNFRVDARVDAKVILRIEQSHGARAQRRRPGEHDIAARRASGRREEHRRFDENRDCDHAGERRYPEQTRTDAARQLGDEDDPQFVERSAHAATGSGKSARR